MATHDFLDEETKSPAGITNDVTRNIESYANSDGKDSGLDLDLDDFEEDLDFDSEDSGPSNV